MNEMVHNLQLRLCRLVVWVNFKSSLELVFRTIVLAGSPQDVTPYYPVISRLRLFCYTFSYLFDCFNHIALFELCKGPVSMRVVTVAIRFLRLLADVYCLAVELVHVIQESEVVVREGMLRILLNAVFETFSRHRVLLKLEVAKS